LTAVLVEPDLRSATPRRPAERRNAARLPAGWPLYALFFGYPLWWALGLQGFVWPMFAVPMAFALLRRRAVRVPRGFGIWLLFILWMLVSALQLQDTSRILSFAYRGSLYLSATILLLYVFNLSTERVPTPRIVYALTWLWLATVVGGYAGILFPHAEFRSLAEFALPGALTSNPFIHSLVHPGLAESTHLLGFNLARPKAPYNYTNEWGSNLAILTPVAAYAFHFIRRRLWRVLLLVALVASFVPIVLSINRGLWLSLSIGILYVVTRTGLRGHARLLFGTLAALALGVALVVFSPLGHVVTERFAHPNTQARSELYSEATDAALESPVLGHGATLPSSDAGPSVGTHGQLWTLVVSQGFPGMALFVGFFLVMFLITWRVSLWGLWPHAVLLVALSQLAIYNMLPVQIHTLAVVIVLAWRDVVARGSAVPAGGLGGVPPSAGTRAVRPRAALPGG